MGWKQREGETPEQFLERKRTYMREYKRARRESDPEWAAKEKERLRQHNLERNKNGEYTRRAREKRHSDHGFNERHKTHSKESKTRRRIREYQAVGSPAACQRCGVLFDGEVSEETGIRSDVRIDHCHRTGLLRGGLCHTCNWLAGAVDSILRSGNLAEWVTYCNRNLGPTTAPAPSRRKRRVFPVPEPTLF